MERRRIMYFIEWDCPGLLEVGATFGVPAGVHEVVAGNLAVKLGGGGGVDHLDEFSGRAAPQLVGADFGAGEYY